MYTPRFFNNLRIAFAIPSFLVLMIALFSTFFIDKIHHGSLDGLVYIPVIGFDALLLGFTATGISTFIAMVGKQKQLLFPIIWSLVSCLICALFAFFMMSEFKNPGAILTVVGVLLPNMAVLIFSIVFRGQ